MSVPAFNQPVVNLPNDATHQAAQEKANTKEATAAVAGSPSSGPSFSTPESKSGPVFAGGQSTAGAREQGASQASAARGVETTGQGLLNSVKGFFSPARPPYHGGPPPRPQPGHGNPPPRPFPQKPDPQYSKRSHEQLAQQLLDNFKAFKDPKNPGYITQQGLNDKAGRPLTGNPGMDQNTRLAREILKRPDLMKALDRDGSTGVLDGRLSRQNIYDVVRSDNPLKFKDDKQLAGAMLENFNKLKGGFWSQNIKTADLNTLTQRPLTGNTKQDQLILLAREVVNRSSLLQQMDNIAGRDNDGRINKQALWWLSR